jgi:hypothetical protein
MLESMHINVQRAESKQNFSIWVYGEDQLVRGSGLHVGHEGVAHNHHFLLPKNSHDFKLLAGDYTVRVFAKRVSDNEAQELAKVFLTISESQAEQLETEDAGIYFDWGPDQQAYHGHVETRKPRALLSEGQRITQH